ncbi:hypothetical protein [Streptomyces mangrovisoli]|uniref:SH3 domain-containing protein n=1 Tax=Streptomyces mangrovisoli TaxID=1428628 RepID=A0A1J4NLX2_9ACTN|nr:hypothetical protein [Streptomyces mangrovisoli]OIJ63264.1 hypothetical protein WN71_035165 [Streptomyces mangrovisoli]
MTRRLFKAAIAPAAVLAAFAGAVPATQAGATTGKPQACNTDGAPVQLHTTDAVHLRAGRGVHRPSLAVLPKNTDFYAECWGRTAHGAWWAYGKVESGRLSASSRSGRGWVDGDFVATGYRH